jgi:hypothetical protein
MSLAITADDRVWAIGGVSDTSDERTYHNTVKYLRPQRRGADARARRDPAGIRGDADNATQIYDPVRNTWKPGTPNYQRTFRQMVRVGNRFILVGGASGDTSYGMDVTEYH